MSKNLHSYIFLVLFTFLSGCATTVDNKDPMEGYNRAIYAFNETVDDFVAEPVAKGYLAITPDIVVKGVNNFFNNIRDVITVFNDLLQLKLEHAANDSGRVLVNSTIGLLGFVDVHSMNGGDRRKEDFGQTLAFYGWKNSSYFVLPILGPSTIRDSGGILVDTLFFDPISYINNDVALRNALRIAQFIDARAELLNASAILDQAALDPYAFQRDSYLQYREKLINDGVTDPSDEYYEDYNMLGKNKPDANEDLSKINDYEFYLSDDLEDSAEIESTDKITKTIKK